MSGGIKLLSRAGFELLFFQLRNVLIIFVWLLSKSGNSFLLILSATRAKGSEKGCAKSCPRGKILGPLQEFDADTLLRLITQNIRGIRFKLCSFEVNLRKRARKASALSPR